MRSLPLFLLVIALGVACGAPTGTEDVSGTYTLHTVDGAHSPFSTYIAYRDTTVAGSVLLVEQTLELVSGSLRLNDDATCSRTEGWRITEVLYDAITFNEISSTVTPRSYTSSCTFSVTGTAITLTYSSGIVHTGSVSGDVLTFGTWVYKR